jgi:OTU domain-containing protein 6
VQERKAAALIEKYAPIDANADAQLEREAQEEERVITGVCNQLGLEMHEVRA